MTFDISLLPIGSCISFWCSLLDLLSSILLPTSMKLREREKEGDLYEREGEGKHLYIGGPESQIVT